MPRNNNTLLHLKKRMATFTRRHRVLLIVVTTIIALYAIIRIFFTPPLMNDVMFSNAFYDRNGRLMRLTLTPDEKYRTFTPLDKISPHLIRATILYEDKYFYYHPGVNPVSLLSATINHFSGHTRPIGASTITMQVARMKYDMQTTTIAGKLKQIAAAIYIDAFYSKDEILTAYLNMAPYGGNIESIGAASLIYFHQSPDKLSQIQAITLSTIPQNPVKRGLNTERGLRNIMNMRRDLVSRWLAQYPSEVNLRTMADMPLHTYGIRDLPFYAPHFTDREIARRRTTAPHIADSSVYTTLDLDLQQRLERQLRTEINRRKSVGVKNASAILLNYKTMQVLSYIGSADYFDKSIYGENDGVRARRSPGSTLKPLIYAAAVDAGHIHGMTLLKDAKISFGVYAPENADSEFYGPILARDALTHSRNIPAINLVRKIGVRNFYKLLSDSGVDGLRAPEYYGISVALGGAEVSMYELADIYATMANLGTRRDICTEIDTASDATTHILSPEAFFITLDMLGRQASPRTNIPFARHNTPNLRHYWKTGTSSSFRDAWTAGIFGDYVLIVWVGNFDGHPNNAFSGAKTAAPIYFALANAVIKYDAARGAPPQNNNFLRPDMNISQVDMCQGVGGIAGTHCPNTESAYFIPGVSPIDVSPVYRAIAIDNESGLRACHADPDTTHMAVYEFWDAEYLDMFRRAGIRRNTPPAFMPGCDLDAIAATRANLVITSPADGTRTVITSDTDYATISLRATSDMDNTKIFWFIDDKMIGTSMPGDTITHRTPMGEHTIRAMDEMGAASTINFSIVK